MRQQPQTRTRVWSECTIGEVDIRAYGECPSVQCPTGQVSAGIVQSNYSKIYAALFEQVILREKICQIKQESARLNSSREAALPLPRKSSQYAQPSRIFRYNHITVFAE